MVHSEELRDEEMQEILESKPESIGTASERKI